MKFLTKNNKIEPYDKSKFDLFLLNIKNGDIALVEKKLFYNKFLVYNYDEAYFIYFSFFKLLYIGLQKEIIIN